jgi:helix-turn-helix protein
MPGMVELLDDTARVAAALPKLRRRILDHLQRGPDSAAGLARTMKLPRQRVHYHFVQLAKAGFLEAGEKRRRRGFTEQVFRPAARAYLIDPGLLGAVGAVPEEARDRFSSAYLLATAGRVAREVSELRKGAAKARKRLSTFTLDTEVRFRSAAERAAFGEQLAGAVAQLVARYHDASAPGGRAFRFVVTGHPARPESPS